MTATAARAAMFHEDPSSPGCDAFIGDVIAHGGEASPSDYDQKQQPSRRIRDNAKNITPTRQAVSKQQRRQPSISDLMRQRSSFGGSFVSGGHGRHHTHPHTTNKVFDNLKTSLVLDSPTASATTYSGSGGSPYSGRISPLSRGSRGSSYGSHSSPVPVSRSNSRGSADSPVDALGMSPMSYISSSDDESGSGGRLSPATPVSISSANVLLLPSTPESEASPSAMMTKRTLLPPSPPSLLDDDHDEGSPSHYASAYTRSIASERSPNDGAHRSPAEFSISTNGSGQRIDHTAMLLGFKDRNYFLGEESSDDEREWNASFEPKSPLEVKESEYHCEDDEGGQEECPNDTDHIMLPKPQDSEDDGDELDVTGSPAGENNSQVDDSSVDVNLGYESPDCDGFSNVEYDDENREESGKEDDGSVSSNDDGDNSSCDGLQLDIGLATSNDMPVTYSHDDFLEDAICTDSTDEIQEYQSTVKSVQGNGTTAITRQDEKQQSSTIEVASTTPSLLSKSGSDMWDREDYGTRKNIHSFESKKKSAAMKALAMKERASSALQAKAQKAKDKVSANRKKKDSKARNNRRSQSRQQQHLDQQEQQPGSRLNGMEITTRINHDDSTDALTQVSELGGSFEVDTSSNAAAHGVKKWQQQQHVNSKSKIVPQVSLASKEFPKFYKHAPKRQSTISATASHSSTKSKNHAAKSATSAISAVNCMKEKASSAISQKAHRARERTMGLAYIASTGSQMISTRQLQRRNSTVKTRQRLALPPSAKDEINSVLSFDRDSDVPSVMNSEGPSSVHEYHGDYAARLGIMVSPGSFATPKAKVRKSSRPGGGGKNLQVIGGDIHLDDTIPHSNLTPNKSLLESSSLASPSFPMAEIRACPSNVSHGSTISCIDENGFLISPPTSIDALDIGGHSVANVGGCLSTVGSTEGSEGTFDPNSFLFLSPLSNTDLDDPDYGMPDLLSRSNSHNAAVMDDETSGHMPPGPPPDVKSITGHSSPTKYNKKLIPRLPPSPRLLPPSGKKMIKKMKGGKNGNSNAIASGALKPPLAGSVSSHRRLRTSAF